MTEETRPDLNEHETLCPSCHGSGKVDDGSECPECEGAGKIPTGI
jgi:DnaJ-class molecular chaperone